MPPRIKKRVLIPGPQKPGRKPGPPKPKVKPPRKLKGRPIPKYKAAGEFVNGIFMASAAEAERYRQLLSMEADGVIEALTTQPRYQLVVNNLKIAEYRADFTYDVVGERGLVLRSVIEDVKGVVTPEFRIKHRLFEALFPQLELCIISVGALRSNKFLAEDGLGASARWVRHHWAGRIPVKGTQHE